MAELYVLQGPDKGRTFQITDDVALIGRGSDQVPLTDALVSRRHAELRREDGTWSIRDLNSANGTFVNGVRIQDTTRLKNGDRIQLGDTLLTYLSKESIEHLSGESIPPDLVRLDTTEAEAAEPPVVARVPSSEDSVVLPTPDTTYAVKSWKAVRELTDVIGTFLTPDQLLHRVMDIIFEEVPAERGVILIRDEETGEMLPEVVRFRDRKARAEATRNAIIASRSIVEHVAATHEGVLCADAPHDERFRNGDSVRGLAERSIICAPIKAREHMLGVIHLDCPASQYVYNEYDLRLITALGYQAGLALENARLVQAHLERERLAATGEALAYLSHSIKNILQGMRAGGDIVKRGLDRRDFAVTTRGWRILDRNLDKVYGLMLNMLAFSKRRDPQLETMFASKVVDDVVALVRDQAEELKIRIETQHDPAAPPIPLDYDGLHQAVLNLVGNALEAVARGTGVIRITTEGDFERRRVLITVTDNGPGVPPDEVPRIFEPFHSTKGHGGTGLGLAVARKNINELGGSIEYHPAPGGGAQFIIRLPTTEARRAAPGDTRGPR